ncbi:hypothetical protein ACH47Z_13125 [Streptomyces sp. NPDC020192]|uniref:hypothetical protein n=1 Tax=Streptomyces sp. NPDC020192 TaxID=3365066 RepID=UPI0037A3FF33
MPNIKIQVTNESTVLSDGEVAAVVPALQKQVTEHFAPAWGTDAQLSYVSSDKLSEDSWWLVVLDNSDQAGALGYHDLTTNFMPLGKVFAGTDIQFGEQWTVTASHELLEMLADPDINRVVFDQPTATTGKLYALEVADACEADANAYDIDGTLVSDFVFPAWFEPNRPANGTRFDYREHIKNPLELLPGGYIGVFDVTKGTGWQQVTAEVVAARYADRPRVGSRRERRTTPRDQWLPSRGRQ